MIRLAAEVLVLPWILSAMLAAQAVTFDQLVADPVGVLLADGDTPMGFRIIALSHAAEACVGRQRDGEWTTSQATACLTKITGAAVDPRLSPYGVSVSSVQSLGDHGLFLSHLAIIFGARDMLDPSACDASLHHRIAEHLAQAAMAHPSGVGRSYPSTAARWPADQAATSYALWLYDKAHASSLSNAPIARYLASIPKEGLPPSELTGAKPDSDTPRGSALAYTVRYLAPVAPEIARSLWDRMERAGFIEKVGPFVALREWPQGIDRAPDIDSGPIVRGLGASATAFGRAAARAIGSEQAAALDRTAAVGYEIAFNTPAVAPASRSALAAAITAQSSIHHPLNAAPAREASEGKP